MLQYAADSAVRDGAEKCGKREMLTRTLSPNRKFEEMASDCHERVSAEVVRSMVSAKFASRFRILSRGLIGASQIFLGEDNGNGGGRVVIKITERPGTSASEAHFLSSWGQAGVAVPSVIASCQDACPEQPFDILILEHVKGVDLATVEVISSTLLDELAAVLVRMHGVKGKGYGRPTPRAPFVGVHPTFESEIAAEYDRRIVPLINAGLFRDGARDLIKRAVEVLQFECLRSGSSMTHSDMNMTNVLVGARDKIHIIDPNCRYTHPAMCAALGYMNLLLHPKVGLVGADRFRNVYQMLSGVVDEVFECAMIVRACLTASTWVSKGRLGAVDQLRQVMIFDSLFSPACRGDNDLRCRG